MAAAAEKFNADVLHVSGAFVTFTKNMPMDLTTLPDDELIKMQLDREVFDSPTLITNDMKQRLDNWLAHFYHWNVWSKLFRREFLLEHEIFFKNLSLSEDKNFCLNCLLHADKYVKMKGFYYIYRNEIESLSRGKSAMISPEVLVSNAPVASSVRIKDGSFTIALAMATRCF